MIDVLSWEFISKAVIPVSAPVVAAIVKRRLERRPKLITYLSHVSAFQVPAAGTQHASSPALPDSEQLASAPHGVQPPQPGRVFAHSIVVRNVGKKTSTNVRIGHAAEPFCYQVFPKVSFSVTTIPNGGWEISIPTLVPNEQVQISYLYFPPVTWDQINSTTKSDEEQAQVVQLLPTPAPNPMTRAMTVVLLYVGVAASAFVVTRALEWLYLNVLQ